MKKYLSLTLLAVALVAVGCDKAEAPTAETPEAASEASGENAEGAALAEANEEGDEDEDGDEDESDENLVATVGERAPDFELKDESGKTHKLSDYKGKIVVLEWTNPDCPYVVRHYEARTMQKTWDALGGSDKVVWLAVDSSHFVKPEDSAEWKKEDKFEHAVLQDPSGRVAKQYEAKTTPHMFVVDAEGVLQYSGAIDDDPRGKVENPENYVEKAVSSILEGKKVEKQRTKPYGCSVKFSS